MDDQFEQQTPEEQVPPPRLRSPGLRSKQHGDLDDGTSQTVGGEAVKAASRFERHTFSVQSRLGCRTAGALKAVPVINAALTAPTILKPVPTRWTSSSEVYWFCSN